MFKSIHFPLILGAALAGCGAEQLGTAAVEGSSAVQQVEAGKQLQEDLQRQIETLNRTNMERLQQAEAAASGR